MWIKFTTTLYAKNSPSIVISESIVQMYGDFETYCEVNIFKRDENGHAISWVENRAEETKERPRFYTLTWEQECGGDWITHSVGPTQQHASLSKALDELITSPFVRNLSLEENK